MALRKKGSRKITVDGTDYRWIVATDRKGLHVVVEHADTPGQRLVVAFDREHEGEATSIIPSTVEQLIKIALEKGWHPDQSGQQIHLGNAKDIIDMEND